MCYRRAIIFCFTLTEQKTSKHVKEVDNVVEIIKQYIEIILIRYNVEGQREDSIYKAD